MTKKDQLAGLIPMRKFTEPARDYAEKHLTTEPLFLEGHPRYLSSVLAALYEECQDRPDLKELILEAAWMGFRMSAALARRKGFDIQRPPE